MTVVVGDQAGGQAGSAARPLVSGSALLRQLRRTQRARVSVAQVRAIDDWVQRKGHRCGVIQIRWLRTAMEISFHR